MNATAQILAPPQGVGNYWATTVAADGTIVGRSNDDNEFLYWQGGQPHSLSQYSSIDGVNDHSQYAITEKVSGGYRAVLQNSDGSRIQLAPGPDSGAKAVNNSGAVLVSKWSEPKNVWVWSGGSLHQAPVSVPIAAGATPVGKLNDNGQFLLATDRRLWRCDLAQCVELPVPAGYTIYQIVDLNNSGQVVGNLDLNGVGYPAQWTGSTVRLLNTDGLGGRVDDLNDQGYVVGRMNTSSGYRAVLWNSGTLRIRIGPTDATRSGAVAINEDNDLVFFNRLSANGKGYYRAYLWRGGEIIDLPPAQGDNSYPMDINDNGTVVGASWVTGAFNNAPPPLGEAYRATLWNTN